MNLRISIVALLLNTFAFGASPATAPSPAAAYDKAFLDGNTQLIWDHSSPAMQKVFESPQKIKQFRDSTVGNQAVGADIQTTTAGGATTLVHIVTTKTGRALKITWTIDAQSAEILGLLIRPTVIVAKPAPLTDAQINAALKKYVDEKHVAPGIVVGIIDDKGKHVFSRGVRELGKSAPVDPDTLFEIASVTKVFTTTLLQEMADRGEVSLPDPIGKYLPATVKTPTRNGKQITLVDLATQSSGLPSVPANAPLADGDDPWADYTLPMLYDFLGKYELPRDIGAEYEYSNLGMGLLGHVIGLAGKSDYESLIIGRICDPLKMPSTRIHLSPEQKSRLARGHSPSGPPVKYWGADALLGDGALYSTANDLLKFLAANMKPDGSPLGAAMAKTHRSRLPAGQLTKIGLGWHITSIADEDGVVWHNGQTGGFHSYVAFNPKTSRGVVVLANNANAIEDLGLYLLGETPTLADVKVPPQRRVAHLTPALLDRCTGDYKSPGGILLHVTREADHLLIQHDGESRYQLLPESTSDFFYTATDIQVKFISAATGQVKRMTLHGNGADDSAEKVN